jgi:catechol 2,3-dioxygenase-like lactoylglutathione lyase family enzyme
VAIIALCGCSVGLSFSCCRELRSVPGLVHPATAQIEDVLLGSRQAILTIFPGGAEFDAAFARIRAQGVRYYAHSRRARPREINHLHGGRGVYFDDPDGHLMEIITHPYGDRPEQI